MSNRMQKAMGIVKIGVYEVETTNEDKLFFPDDDISKGDLIAYYRGVAETMIPHMKDRPVTMHRFPDGIQKHGFYHKNIPDYFPDWMDAAEVEKEGGKLTHAVCNHPAALVYLTNFGCITPHIWLSRRDKIRMPDRLVFDLDPPTDDFTPVRNAAIVLGTVLRETGLEPFAMTTGSRGIHVVSPIRRDMDFDEVRGFARTVAEYVASQHSAELTTEQRKEKRGDRVYLDYMRNAYAQTAVPPYGVRARPGAPVAVPLEWDELRNSGLSSTRYTIRNTGRRLAQKLDPWREIDRHARSLKGLQQHLKGLVH